MQALLPLAVKLAGRAVIVVGSGAMGTARVKQLAGVGARVTVVAPSVHPEAAAAASMVHRREFRPSDLEGMWLAVAAAPPEVNLAVAAAAEALHLLVNAVDDPACGTVHFPGVVRRGGVTVAVSTGGGAPALSGLLREGIEAVLPEDLGSWLQVARSLRQAWKAQGIPLERRRPLLLERLNALYAGRDAGPRDEEPDR
jgi:uroporphyrin-III C-methyltransferase / precorrin-2 dehydrogenase / sirohydrochlorin ferrochelatase